MGLVALGCDRLGRGQRLKCISDTLKHVDNIMSTKQLSRDINCGICDCGGSGGNSVGRDHGEQLFYSNVWLGSQINAWLGFLGVGRKKGHS